MSNSIIVEDVIKDLERIQQFQANSLVQRDRLGARAFEEAVEPAQRLIDLFQQLPKDMIHDLPFRQKQQIQEWSKSAFNLFEQVLAFDDELGNVTQRKDALVDSLKSNYQGYFDQLFPLISYSVARTVDFASLESRGRAAVQAISDEKASILKAVSETAEEAARILAEVREAAAEQGVTQTAQYFKLEAETHATASKRWLTASVVSAIVVVAYAVSTLFWSHYFSPGNALMGAQLIASKLLIFGVLVYVLVQCVRSYSAHRHNYVTNKHRQNALMTYKTLAEAGNTPELRDAVLQHAAAAIYAPNDSGYLKGEERGYGAQGLLALVPRMTGGQPPSGSA